MKDMERIVVVEDREETMEVREVGDMKEVVHQENYMDSRRGIRTEDSSLALVAIQDMSNIRDTKDTRVIMDISLPFRDTMDK